VRSSSITLAACLFAAAVASPSPAQTSGERGASILIFPKVVSDTTADSLIQIANLSGSRVDAFCTYVDGRVGWQAAGFGLSLLADQPLHWIASRGRPPGSGDPNDVPPAPADFRGELLCVEVDGTGAPSGGNRLVGRATVTALADGDAFAYAAVGLQGLGFNDGDEVLCIGGEPSDACFIGAEYDPCPGEWILSHPVPGAADRQLGAGSRQDTRIAIAPCSQNVRDGEPGSVLLDLEVTNELAQRFSTSASVTCWADLSLADVSGIFDVAVLGGEAAVTRIQPGASSGGFVVVAEIERRASAAGPVISRAALTPHQDGAAAASDAIILPMGRP
jgi:hypothetical protein